MANEGSDWPESAFEVITKLYVLTGIAEHGRDEEDNEFLSKIQAIIVRKQKEDAQRGTEGKREPEAVPQLPSAPPGGVQSDRGTE